MIRLQALALASLALSTLSATAVGQSDEPGWSEGRGWGRIWGEGDQIGALNAMTPATRLAALELVKQGRVYDLGVTFSRESLVWPGHNKSEVMTFRSPDGVRRMGDMEFTKAGIFPVQLLWHSCALFLSDNVATQIDGLGHAVAGDPPRAYNGITLEELGGDFGVRKLSAAGIPPIVNRAVLLDIARLEEVDALPAGFTITPEHVRRAEERQAVKIQVGDVVLLRTGTLQFWGEDGSDHELLAKHDSAGIDLTTARYLVEERGALAIGSDTSGLEVPAPEGSTSFLPVHEYLLIQQGVHILEFHYLEDLARDGVWEFCYMATTNKIAGTTAGFALRPIALR